MVFGDVGERERDLGVSLPDDVFVKEKQLMFYYFEIPFWF